MKTEKGYRKKVGYTENQIERALGLAITKAGGLCWKWPATARAGVPERIVVYNGRVVFVVLKRGGGMLSPIQVVTHRLLRGAGADVRVIDSIDCVDEFVRELTEEV